MPKRTRDHREWLMDELKNDEPRGLKRIWYLLVIRAVLIYKKILRRKIMP